MKASILIPAFNAATYLNETLQSCVEQGLQYVEEIIIVDDGSEDNTLQVANAFAQSHPEVKCIIESNRKRGACAARNHAFLLSSARAIQWLDADDILGLGKLKRQLAILHANPDCLIASKWCRFEGDLNNLWPEEKGKWSATPKTSTPEEWLCADRMMIPAGWLGTKKLFESIGPWDESLNINQDGEYFTRAIAASKGVLFEGKSRVYYRSSLQNSVSKFSPEKATSLFTTAESFEATVKTLGQSPALNTAISNKYQQFIYRVYPHVPELRKKAENKVRKFGTPTTPLDLAESKFAKLFCWLFGWKLLVQVRRLRK